MKPWRATKSTSVLTTMSAERKATALEIVLPTYLVRFRERGEFTQPTAAP